ncbi:hypothetical protein SDC9_161213 [bioreactor metagenome]|uniref:Uncharacterized protein n=1 Tax=bioreactor metagenome TaxID=1076179 RepID=A0A645FHR1_9ZZZZ
MLEVHLRIARRVGLQQEVAVVLPALVAETTRLIHQIEHRVDALGGVVVPGGKHQQVRSLGDLGLVPGVRLDARAQLGVVHHQHLIGLQAAGGGGQADGLENALELLRRELAGRVELLGGVAPLQFLQRVGHGVPVGTARCRPGFV